jgi:hypothetical protein
MQLEDLDLEDWEPKPNSNYNPSTKLQKKLTKEIYNEHTQQQKTWSYYKRLKEEKPLLYLDPKMAVEIDRSAQLLGERFFDTEDDQ